MFPFSKLFRLKYGFLFFFFFFSPTLDGAWTENQSEYQNGFIYESNKLLFNIHHEDWDTYTGPPAARICCSRSTHCLKVPLEWKCCPLNHFIVEKKKEVKITLRQVLKGVIKHVPFTLRRKFLDWRSPMRSGIVMKHDNTWRRHACSLILQWISAALRCSVCRNRITLRNSLFAGESILADNFTCP